MARIPTVVSIDATPKQIDDLGASYKHRVRGDVVERAKWQMHANCFHRASSLISWSKWAADSLVVDYGVERDKIEIIPPGVVPSLWRRPERRVLSNDRVKILFVGGDFQRKGGQQLVDAVRRLRRDAEVVSNGIEVELHLVTSAEVPSEPGIFVHHDLTPNSQELVALFHSCDIFSLPTRGDCTPLVLAEAATAGLPAVVSDVGATAESVVDGVTGHLVGTDVESLTASLRLLVLDAEHRLELGSNAAAHAALTMDSEQNARRVLDGLISSSRVQPSATRVALTVSGNVAPDLDAQIAAGVRPLADYRAISDAVGADLIDWSHLRREGGVLTNMIRRVGGHNLAMAYYVFRRRKALDVIISDGEQVGLPLAAMLRLPRQRTMRHVMIGHRLSPAKKTVPIRALGLSGGIDEVLVYSSSQREVAERYFGGPGKRVRLIDFMVDTTFFTPTRELVLDDDGRRPLLCTAGREFRDYPTLIEAVRDLDVDVVIASASPWSKRSDNSRDVELPANVVVTALTQRELRDQLDDADILIMPLLESDFQAGITTILEAMAMERPVICTATTGQTDVIEDGRTGRYVPPGDVGALRDAIRGIVDDPKLAIGMGRRGRRLAEKRADVRLYAELFADIVSRHSDTGRPGDSDRPGEFDRALDGVTWLDPSARRRPVRPGRITSLPAAADQQN